MDGEEGPLERPRDGVHLRNDAHLSRANSATALWLHFAYRFEVPSVRFWSALRHGDVNAPLKAVDRSFENVQYESGTSGIAP
jgi:hypothetical protein